MIKHARCYFLTTITEQYKREKEKQNQYKKGNETLKSRRYQILLIWFEL